MQFLTTKIPILLLFVFSCLVLLPGIEGDSLLLQGDEVMHIRTIRESLSANTFLHPVLGGYSNPYKPPLLFWSGMVSDFVIGKSFFSERLPSVLLGASSVVLIFLILKILRADSKIRWLTSIAYLFSLGLYKFAKLAMMEVYLVFLFLLSIYFYIRYLKNKKWTFLFLSGLVSGIGALLKGPILIIYLSIVIVTLWGFTRFRIRNGKNIFLKNGSRFHLLHGANWKEILFIWLPIALLPLTLWFLAIALWTDQGLGFIKFFIGTENLGKFGSENQPELRLILGIIGYTVPWTVPFLLGVWSTITQTAKNKKQIIAKWLIISSIFILLLHLLPNRKDPYYTLPSLSLGFIAIALGLRPKEILKNLTGNLNLISQLVLSSIIIVFGIFFEVPFIPFLFLPGMFLFYGILDRIWFNRERILLYSSGILSPIFSILIFQLYLLPSIPKSLPNLSNLKFNELCVVSNNPWDAWQVENANPHFKILYSPSLKANCDKTSIPYLVLNEESIQSIPQGYEISNSWKIWAGKIPEINSGLPKIQDPKLYKSVYLLEKNIYGENSK